MSAPSFKEQFENMKPPAFYHFSEAPQRLSVKSSIALQLKSPEMEVDSTSGDFSSKRDRGSYAKLLRRFG